MAVASRDPDRPWLRRLGSAMHIGKCCKLPIRVAVLVLNYWIVGYWITDCQGYRYGVRWWTKSNILYYKIWGSGLIIPSGCCAFWTSRLLRYLLARSVLTWTADLLAARTYPWGYLQVNNRRHPIGVPTIDDYRHGLTLVNHVENMPNLPRLWYGAKGGFVGSAGAGETINERRHA